MPLSTGVDFVEGTVAAALGLPYDFCPKRRGGSAIRFITADHAGTIASINVPDELSGADGVEEIELYLKPGDSIETPHSSNDCIGHVVCSGANADEAAAHAECALGEIEVELI